MGADIHVFAERMAGDGNWYLANDFSSIKRSAFYVFGDSSTDGGLHYNVRDRDYGFFAALAGVRGVGPQSKGLPSDVSFVVKEHSDRWGPEGHSHSWNTATEFALIFAKTRLGDEKCTDYIKARMTGDKSQNDIIAEILSTHIGVEPDYDHHKEVYQLDKLRFVYWFDN